MVELLSELPEDGQPVAHILLTHGASQPMDSRFFKTFVPMLLERGIAVTRFEFAYMQKIRETGKRRPPPKIAPTCLPPPPRPKQCDWPSPRTRAP